MLIVDLRSMSTIMYVQMYLLLMRRLPASVVAPVRLGSEEGANLETETFG